MKSKSGSMALAVMFIVLLISGCGGGGGGDSSPAAPAAPTGVAATAGDSSASIGWTAVAGATSYNIYYSTTNGVTKATGTKITGAASPNIVSGLTNGTPYYFVVTAVNGIGESEDSSQVSSTPALAPPAAPTGVTATAGAGEATIAWSAVAGATSYNIYYLTTSGVTKATGNKLAGRVSPSIVTSLTNGTPYYFIVTAVNAAGEGSDSSQVSATPTLAPPAAPTGVTATAGHGEATIAWSAVAGATSYNIYHSATSGVTKATGSKIAGVTSPSIVTGLTNNTPRYFVVTAVNAAGEGADSSQVSATPTPALPPDPPTGVSAVAGPGQATISWSAVTGATSYNIYYSTTSGVTKATGIKITGITSPNIVTELTRGTPYFFVVTAVGPDGESLESSQVSATPDPPNPTFAQGDLAGTWTMRVIQSGSNPGWYGVTATVDSSGNVSTSSPVGTITAPALSTFSITSGAGGGVVTETSNATFHGKMTTSKNLIFGTSTSSVGTFASHIFVKRVAGVIFSGSDLANTTVAYQKIYSGGSNIWEKGSGTINGSGLINFTSVEDPSGPVSPPSATAISVNSTTGIVSIAAEPTFSGVMSPDKKVIVGTSDASGTYSLRILQMRGQTYIQTDLAGTSMVHSFHSDPTASWAYGTFITNSTGTTTCSGFLDSDSNTTCIGDYDITIDSPGNVTTSPNPDFKGGMMSFGKDMVVSIGDWPPGPVTKTGSFMEIRAE